MSLCTKFPSLITNTHCTRTINERHHQRRILPVFAKRLEHQKGRPNVNACAAEENLEEEI